nr:MAG TPA: hypothetical protein [Caudoviricetes sp.]
MIIRIIVISRKYNNAKTFFENTVDKYTKRIYNESIN